MLREVKVILWLLTRTVTELEIRLNPEVASQAGDVPSVGLVDILEPLVQSIVTSTLSLKTCEQGIQFSQLGKQHRGCIMRLMLTLRFCTSNRLQDK